MKIITISSPVADVLGVVVVKVTAGTTTDTVSRRVTRSATLDGGAVFVDGGQTEADETINIDLQGIEKTVYDNLSRMVKLYPRLVVASEDGVFYAAPNRLTSDLLTLLVENKDS